MCIRDRGPSAPLVEPQVSRRNLHLPGDIGDHFVGHLCPATRKPAVAGVELQQDREAESCRAPLASHLTQLVADQSPAIDQLVLVHHTRHDQPAPSRPDGGEEPPSRLSLIHISEPTRPYSISYAVFCLKKNNR